MKAMRAEEGDDDEGDREMTFRPDLEKRTKAKAQARAEGKSELPPTVWEQAQAKAKAKRLAKRTAAAAVKEEDGDDEDDLYADDGMQWGDDEVSAWPPERFATPRAR